MRIQDPNTVNNTPLSCDMCKLDVNPTDLHHWCPNHMVRIHVECETTVGIRHYSRSRRHRLCRKKHITRDINPLFPEKKKRKQKTAVKHPIKFNNKFKAFVRFTKGDKDEP